MTAFIHKKEQMQKQETTESVDMQCDSTNTNTAASTWKDHNPTETNKEDSLIVKLTKQHIPSVIPQVDGPLDINVTDDTTQTSHISLDDESTQTEDTNKPKPYKGIGGFDYYTLDYDDPKN